MKNIMFLFPDQLRTDFLSCYGADFIDTPNIDSLCHNGVKYENCITPCPLCVPARASVLTGRNAFRNGVFDNDCWLRPDHDACGVYTWPALLGQAGYHTLAVGKMHFYPWDALEGFDERIIAEDKRHITVHDDYAKYLEHKGLRKYHINEYEDFQKTKGAVVSKVSFEDHVDTWVADRTIDFIENYTSEKPFAVMVGFPSPHCPYDPTKEYADMFDPKDMPDSIPATADSDKFIDKVIEVNKMSWNSIDYSEFTEEQKKKVRAHYAGLVKQIDDNIGRIINAVKEKGIIDDTVFIFAADHGDMLGDYGFIGKANFYESSVKVPLIIKAPDMRGDRMYNHVVSLLDVTSSILRYAGVEPTTQADSTELPLLFDNPVKLKDYTITTTVFFGIKGYMIRTDEWKLCRYTNDVSMLFNLKEDPKEQINRILDPECATIREKLDNILTREIMEGCQDGNKDTFIPDAKYLAIIPRLDPKYNETGWERPYPFSILSKVFDD